MWTCHRVFNSIAFNTSKLDSNSHVHCCLQGGFPSYLQARSGHAAKKAGNLWEGGSILSQCIWVSLLSPLHHVPQKNRWRGQRRSHEKWLWLSGRYGKGHILWYIWRLQLLFVLQSLPQTKKTGKTHGGSPLYPLLSLVQMPLAASLAASAINQPATKTRRY